ncbi:hypothetical protein BGAFAR04_K0033 (plasmid) [Borreliella garinii Far04]|nr:hypothetical protein BGAFAR04_K0033 [Borreliella garinii Far04]
MMAFKVLLYYKKRASIRALSTSFASGGSCLSFYFFIIISLKI